MATKKTLTLDMAELTVGDLEDFEEYTGKTLASLMTGEDFDLSGKTLTGMLLIVFRKEDPSTTVEDIRKLKVGEYSFEMKDSSMDDADSPLEEGDSATDASE